MVSLSQDQFVYDASAGANNTSVRPLTPHFA